MSFGSTLYQICYFISPVSLNKVAANRADPTLKDDQS